MPRTPKLGPQRGAGGDAPTSVPAGPIAVLMYHAVEDASAHGVAADPHYTVSPQGFAEQLRAVLATGHPPVSVRDVLDHRSLGAGTVAFTFDDGHRSNLAAADALAAVGGRADFFINPGLVGQAGLLDWTPLREMAAMGHSIQSHGHLHEHLDTLTPAEVEQTLRRSRLEIEDRLGLPVTLFAPPGGRMVPGLPALAAAAGYRAVCSSRAGLWAADRSATGRVVEVPRLAVLAATTMAQYRRWITCHRGELGRQWLRERMLRSAKRVLGRAGYERARQVLLREAPAAPPERR
jgi:peptidoglycan/xylan/chitin deacetylase (PgdA/CDA1 family)